MLWRSVRPKHWRVIVVGLVGGVRERSSMLICVDAKYTDDGARQQPKSGRVFILAHMKSTLISLAAILVLCFTMSTSQAQEAKNHRFSLDVLGGLSASDFFSLSPTASINGQIRVKERWVIGATYEHYFHDSTVGSITGDLNTSVTTIVSYENGYSVGVYGGMQAVSRARFRLTGVIGPTISGNSGTNTLLIQTGSEFSVEENRFSNNGALGLGLWLRGEYDITNRIYGVMQLSGHENFADKLTRGSIRLGVGLRL